MLLVSSFTAAQIQAQGPTGPPAAPLPSALATANKLFLGNAGNQENGDCLRAYNQFYADLNGLGRYSFVGDPGEADLVLELHYEVDPDAAEYGNHGGNNVRQFRVVIEDPHTRVVLWTLVERTNYATFKANRQKNLVEVVAKLAEDVGLLLNKHPVAPDNNSTTKHLW